MTFTFRSLEAQRGFHRYMRGVRLYLSVNPAPTIDAEPCTTCTAPAGRACTGRAYHVSRVTAHTAAIEARRAAARAYGERAAHEPTTPAAGRD